MDSNCLMDWTFAVGKEESPSLAAHNKVLVQEVIHRFEMVRANVNESICLILLDAAQAQSCKVQQVHWLHGHPQTGMLKWCCHGRKTNVSADSLLTWHFLNFRPSANWQTKESKIGMYKHDSYIWKPSSRHLTSGATTGLLELLPTLPPSANAVAVAVDHDKVRLAAVDPWDETSH